MVFDPEELAVPPAPEPHGPGGGFPKDPKFYRLNRDQFDGAVLRGGVFQKLVIVDGLLKSRGAIYRDLKDGKVLGNYIISLFLISVLFSAIYGAIIGFFTGGIQIGYAAMKLPIVIVGSLLICLPNFYIFNALFGSRLTFGRTVMMLLCMVAPLTIILVGFAPISWFFSMSSGSAGFMTFLHVFAMVVAVAFGLSCLETVKNYLTALAGEQGSANSAYLKVWTFIYLLVGCQMAYYLGPLMTEGPFHSGERGIFLEFFKGLAGHGMR